MQAAQIIYTHVEREESPRGIGGFQTLLYTHALLAEAEVAEIEGRLLYLGSADGPPKCLFFTTTAGKCVVAQVVPLPGPDRLGRGGRYLAHALVLTAADFARCDADPWGVLGTFGFVTTVAAALQMGDTRTGDIPAAALELPETPLAGPPSSWPPAELVRLALLALHAAQRAQERSAVAFIGNASQIAAALAAALVAVPVALRWRCSFDTYFVRGNLVATYFWAIGLPEDPGRPNLLVVDAAGRRVPGPLSVQPETVYERWATAALSAGRFEEAARESAYALAGWLEGSADDSAALEAASATVVEEMFRLNSQIVQERLQQQMEQLLPPALATRLRRALATQVSPAGLFREMRHGFELPVLLDLLYETYAQGGLRAPARDEVRALGTLLRANRHPLLGVLLAAWTGQGGDLRRGLEVLDDATYQRFAESALAVGLVAPPALATARHGEALICLYLASVEESQQDLRALVRALLEAGAGEALVALVPHLTGRPKSELKDLDRFLRRQKGAPAGLREGVEKALDACS